MLDAELPDPGWVTPDSADKEDLLTGKQILKIVRSLAGHVDLRDAIKSVSNELQSVVAHDHFDAAMFTEEMDRTVVYETGLKTSWGSANGLNVLSPIRDILSGKVDHMITSNAMLDPRMVGGNINAEPIHTFRLKSRVHARIEIGGQLIGALSLSSRTEGLYSVKHVNTAMVIADIIGPYLYALRQAKIAKKAEIRRIEDRANAVGFKKGARLLTEQLERERERIGMDLHDQTLAELTRMIRSVDTPSVSPEDKLKGLRSALSNSANELRNIIENAKPALLHLFGLVEAVDGFLDVSMRELSIEWRVDATGCTADGFNGLSDLMVLSIFRIIQEAVNNVIHHSKASRLVVSFTRSGSVMLVDIEDDGKGIPTTTNFKAGGLENMKTRADLMGAMIEFSESVNLAGTRVRLSIPIISSEVEMLHE